MIHVIRTLNVGGQRMVRGGQFSAESIYGFKRTVIGQLFKLVH